MRLRSGSLFSGYGGLALAVEEALDARAAWVADYEPPSARNPRPSQGASKILARRFPDVPNLGDVTLASWSQVEPVDVVEGGSPCQDVSPAGARAGMRVGTRSGLWASMCDAINIIRPRLVVWENVQGVLSAPADSSVEPCPVCVGNGSGPHLRALGRVVGDLSELGYDAVWCGLRASDVGAPHGRFRVFVLAWPADTESYPWRVEYRNPVATEDPNGSASRERRIAAPGQASGGWPRADSGRSDRAPAADPESDGWYEGRPESAGQLGGSDAALGGTGTPADPDSLGLLGKQSGLGAWEDLEGCRAGGASALADPNSGGWGADQPDAAQGKPDIAWGDYAPAIARWEAVLGRPAPAPTELSARGSRRLSPAFVEWLMGLPAGWVTDVPDLSRNDQLKALGNGVVPQQGVAAIRYLMQYVPPAVWQVTA